MRDMRLRHDLPTCLPHWDIFSDSTNGKKSPPARIFFFLSEEQQETLQNSSLLKQSRTLQQPSAFDTATAGKARTQEP
jgi:hypothetical protein